MKRKIATAAVPWTLGYAQAALARQRSRRRHLFAALVDVLHHSRRRQAERILRQYRHLIANSGQRTAFSQLNLEDHGHVGH